MLKSITLAALLVTTAASAQTTTGGASLFTTVAPGEALISKVTGVSVENPADQHLGSIREIAYMGADIRAYIVEAGGHWVAIAPTAVQFRYDAQAKTWSAHMNAEPAQIKAAPEFSSGLE